ncbi:right-handed parallel beta-helix repeat-containing protein [Geobacter argillaceus]|uniref:Copper-binding protein NosD n=1 Tax=Geobacter argillaceus TaxID=345631 RepID=A0A562V0I4_9BACT|nr:right-handed parallel beta-helix repeat-containing protein [Geobacter argillaceus]TWJ11335.1 copper-binding protein NosD [Geobacter argillaceus]
MNRIGYMATMVLFLLVAMVAVASAACTAIDHIPYTIQKSGSYCLTKDLTLKDGAAAILVDAEKAVIDLGGHRLSGTGEDAGYGIRSDKGVIVRNGTVAGFYFGVTGGAGSMIENLRVENSTRTGILVNGDGSLVRNNTVTDARPIFEAYGIVAMGAQNRILDNTITEIKGAASGRGFGIRVYTAGENVIQGNRVANTALIPNTFGILIAGPESQKNAVTTNTIANMEKGVVYERGSDGTNRGNRTSGVTHRYIGGNDDGGNE